MINLPKPVILCSLIIAFFFPQGVHAQNELSAEEILLESDEVRNPQLDYIINVKVTDYKPRKQPEESTFQIMRKDKVKAIVKTLSPPIDKGRVFLALDKAVWLYLPDLSKPLRITLAQRLTGQVANGDLARANFSGDYTAELIRTEQINTKDCYVLNLTAKTDDITYSRIVLWVEKGTLYPLKGEFYAFSGRLLKTCSYEEYKEFGGRIRPTRLVMTDFLMKEQYSVLDFDSMNIGLLPEKYFTKDYMKKITY